MKMDIGSSGEIIFREVYSGLVLESDDNEKIGICMRDSGFEFSYGGVWYSAKKGVITPMTKNLQYLRDDGIPQGIKK